jgi:hypothetical protein
MEDEVQTEAGRSEEVNWPGCGLYAGWMLATLFGMGVGWAVAWWVSFRVPGFLATFTIGALSGAILGGFQWLVLRLYLQQAVLWIPATTLGWMVGFWAGSLAPQWLQIGEGWLGLAAGLGVGLFTGVLQWLVLRRQASKAGWWVAASLAAWISGLFYYRPGVSLFGFLYGALAGIVTGLALVWLLQRPDAE